jgi:invasion protein IalB
VCLQVLFDLCLLLLLHAPSPPLLLLAAAAAAATADIGAFGPRNYAAESDAPHSAAALHNKPDAASGACSKQRQKQQYEEFELPAKLRCVWLLR